MHFNSLRLILLAFAAAISTVAKASVPVDLPANTEWAIQLGTPAFDGAVGVVVDSFGNSYLAGTTSGNLVSPSIGPRDTFLIKYDPLGSMIWFRQFGTDGNDEARAAAIDSLGNVYVTGVTDGDFNGTGLGQSDGFLRKFDSHGTVLWTRQFGTDRTDSSNAVAVDSAGNAYLTGYTFGDLAGPRAGLDDAFLVKFDPLGNIDWSRQFGTSAGEAGFAVAVDAAGNPYVAGYTEESLFRPVVNHLEAFVVKFDDDGNQLWGRQSPVYRPYLDVDGEGNAYLSGSVDSPDENSEDIYVAKYSPSGGFLWSRELATDADEWANAVTVDDNGNAFVVGITFGVFEGEPSALPDGLLIKLDPLGNPVLIDQYGADSSMWPYSVAADGRKVFIAGQTKSSFGGPNAGGEDAFLVKLTVVPEPSPLLLALIVAVVFYRAKPDRPSTTTERH